jgi:16S rRNA (cytidine1402-2'-O)-methyltransferase
VLNHQKVSLAPGLYFVGTPIGTARDITLRALDVLASADVLASEDTRSLRRLMDIHGVPLAGRPLVAYHDHSGAGARARLLQAMAEGRSVAYASEAGMPMISDPGFDLGRAASEAGYTVTSAPGPSAVTTALVLAGLPTDAFFFAGFLPNTGSARRTRLQELAAVPGTLMFYESPKRVAAALRDMTTVLGGDRQAALCRELTKKFEEVRQGSLEELATALEAQPVKGEIVVMVDRGRSANISDSDIERDLRAALADNSVRDAAELVAARHGVPRRGVYQIALNLGKDRS